MCEVQGVGAPGVGGDRGASPPPGRLSVSSSGAEEDHNTPRGSLLGHSNEGLAGKPSEDTSNSHKESGEIEASELSPATSSKMKEVEEEDGDIMEEKKMHEEEKGDIKEKKTDEEEKEEKKVKEKKTMELKEEEKDEEKEEEEVKESESEAKDVVKDCVCDESERENQENERRDEIVENKLKLENVENTVKVEKVEITLRVEEEIREEKIVDEREAEEENRRGNDEQAASSLDSPKDEEGWEQAEEEEEKEEAAKKKEVQEKREEKTNEGKDKHEDTVTNKREEETEDKEVKKDKKKEEQKEEKEEGVDPFRPKSTKDASTTRKVTKTVNFLDSELKKQIENNLAKRNTINTSSFSSSSSKSKEDEDEEELARLEGEVEEKTSRQWTLGEGNPVYRLSLKLSPNLFNTTDIPGANQHKEVEKTGFLTKLSGRSFPYIAQWKRRYCVLSKGRLYYYEREDSKAGDKSNGVIQLEYFDQVAEAGPKECKKATNVFIITSQDRSFFDPGRHLFSADTLPDMKDWIRRLQAALDQIRNNNRPAASNSPSASPSAKDGGGKRRREEAAESKDGSKGSQQQNSSSKDRKKKKEESGRGRKSSRGGVSSQTQTSMVEPMTCEVDGGRPAMATPKGGVMLPGFSSRKDPQAMSRAAQRRSGEGEAEEDLPQAGPTLTCVTKQRVKGPQGRRAPQNRRMAAAAALKKRASSLSALEHQDATDNRSECSEGATRSSRDSRTPEGDLKAETESEEENERKKLKKEALDEKEQEIQDNSPERQFKIDNVDDGLFFKAGLKEGGTELEGGSEGEGQKNRRSAGLKVNFEESPASPSKNGTLGKFFRFRDSFTSTKRKKYEVKEGLVAEHPDMMNNSRWTCVVL